MKKRLVLLVLLCLMMTGCTPDRQRQTADEILVPIEEMEYKEEPIEEDSQTLVAPSYSVEESEKKVQESSDSEEEDPVKTEEKRLQQEEISRQLEEDPLLYAYHTMDSFYKPLYTEIYRILINMQTEEVVSTTVPSHLDYAFQCVLADHPEIFYVTGYTYVKFMEDNKITQITFSGTYTMPEAEAQDLWQQLQVAAKTCISGIPSGADEYEKVKYVYEYLVNITEYKLDSKENQNICSVLLYGESVCQGYAKTMQYLLNEVDVFATLVTGTVSSGEGHSWNLVQIQGAYYYVDVTWGDAFYKFESASPQENPDHIPAISYDYLCVTTKQLQLTHRIDNIVPLPRCISLDANYYVKEGRYFTQYDETKLQELFQQAYEKGSEYITLKCATYEVYTKMSQELLENQKVFAFLNNDNKSIAYTNNEEQFTLSFWLTQ